MPRSELNNPTERIGRLLEEFEELLCWSKAAFDLLTPAQIQHLPNFPPIIEFKLETQRRNLTHSAVKAARLTMQRVRHRGGYRVRSRKQFSSEEETGIASAIHEAITETPVGQTTTDLSEDIQPTETHVIESQSSGEIEDPLAGGLSNKGFLAVQRELRRTK